MESKIDPALAIIESLQGYCVRDAIGVLEDAKRYILGFSKVDITDDVRHSFTIPPAQANE